MEAANDHLLTAQQHLDQAASILHRRMAERYCRDVPKGRILGLLDLFAQLQEVQRLAAAVAAITQAAPVGSTSPSDWPLSAGD
jgi:hypothetical protein